MELQTELAIYQAKRDELIKDRNNKIAIANFKKFVKKHNEQFAETAKNKYPF